MKKLIYLFISITFTWNCYMIPVQAEEFSEDVYSTFQIQIERMKKFSIIPASFEGTPTSLVSRRQAIETVLRLYHGGEVLWFPSECMENWIDVSDNSNDAGLVNQAFGLKLFYGKETISGQKYADLDSYITVEETLLLLLRLLGQDNLDEIIQNTAFEQGWDKNFPFLFAQKIGLINYVTEQDLHIAPVVPMDIERSSQAITVKEFIDVVNRSLYIPIWYGYDYENPTYLINIFAKA